MGFKIQLNEGFQNPGNVTSKKTQSTPEMETKTNRENPDNREVNTSVNHENLGGNCNEIF